MCEKKMNVSYCCVLSKERKKERKKKRKKESLVESVPKSFGPEGVFG
jgi:hypothetical protein